MKNANFCFLPNFAIVNGLERYVQHLFHTLVCLEDQPSHPSADIVEPFSPLGYSNHSLIYLSCHIAPVRLWILLRGGVCGTIELRQCTQDFPWNNFCFHDRDPTKCAILITEAIFSGIDAYNPNSFSHSTSNNSFNHACLLLSMTGEKLTDDNSAFKL